MFETIIEDCFEDVKLKDANEAKKIFGLIWATFASKKVRFNDGDVFLSWRELSAKLATIYNKWYGCSFTTDAFINVANPLRPIGEDEVYDDTLMSVYRHKECVGIFIVRNGPSIRAHMTEGAYIEIDVVTGEEHYYKQEYNKGHCVDSPKRISAKDYEKLCLL